MMDRNFEEMAETLYQAALTKTPRKAFTEKLPLTLDDGYAIQKAGLEIALSHGAALCGYKMGLTSRAKQIDVKVFEPIRGYLTLGTQFKKNVPLPIDRWIHPRVEPEIAVILKSRITGENVSIEEVRETIDFIGPAFEILDSRFDAFSFKLPDVVADNTSGAGFCLGDTNYLSKLSRIRLMGVTVKKNNEIVETGAPAAVLGDPLRSVCMLAGALYREEKAIEKGQIILTGGITTSVPFAKGDVIEIIWPGESFSIRA